MQRRWAASIIIANRFSSQLAMAYGQDLRPQPTTDEVVGDVSKTESVVRRDVQISLIGGADDLLLAFWIRIRTLCTSLDMLFRTLGTSVDVFERIRDGEDTQQSNLD